MSLLEEVIGSFRSQKRLADRAIDQLDEGEFNTTLGDEGNSIATICQHVAGNQRSRWTDFLTTDGEKPDRHRDEEFEPSGAPRGEILDRWEEGWAILFQTLESLTEEDLSKTVTIRGEAHTVTKALLRQVSHYGYHVGQIVQLARVLRGPHWETLSIARGQSEAYNAEMRGKSS